MQAKFVIAALIVMVCLLAPAMIVKAEKSSAVGCEICEWLIASAEGLVNKTKPQIEQSLLEICSKLGPYEQMCDQMVLMELPDIIDQILANEKPELVCQQISMCANTSAIVAAPKATSGICNMCQLVVTQVENWADSNNTITQLEKQLEQVCTVVPGAYQAICTYAVEQYLPNFVHQIEQQYPPLKCCQEVGLCSAAVAVAPVVASAELCPICKAAVGFLKTKIGTFDVQAVKQQLDFACSFFKIADCQTLVDKAAEIAENLQTEDASTICSTIVDVCPKAQVATFNPFKKFLAAKNSAYCPTCLRITEYLEDVVVSDIAVKEVEKIANEGCAKLGEFKSLCEKFVPLAVEELKSLLLKKLTPQKVCSTLKMCDAQEIAFHAAVAASNELCLGCEYIISVADNWLITNSTQKSVKDTLDMVCNDFVPSPYKTQCVALVDQYVAELTQLFENKVFNPQTVCKAIGVCTSSQRRAAIKMN